MKRPNRRTLIKFFLLLLAVLSIGLAARNWLQAYVHSKLDMKYDNIYQQYEQHGDELGFPSRYEKSVEPGGNR